MDLPPAVRRGIETCFGDGQRVVSADAIQGGCITPVARLSLSDGTAAFLKFGSVAPESDGFFRAEAASLRAIAASKSVRVPNVLGAGDDWLLLEWLEPGRAGTSAWSRLGRDLARMHRTQAADFGWEHHNWIGSLPQRNHRHSEWHAFWREERVEPQWQQAQSAGLFDSRDALAMRQFLAALGSMLSAGDEDGPSLLHGDLWSGNAHGLASGEIALIDASSYFGHREVDLAMASLFGGFPNEFLAGYEREWPLASGWRQRKHAYQLYYLLVHVNLFGASYVSGVRGALRRALDAAE